MINIYEQLREKNRLMTGLSGRVLKGRDGHEYRVEGALDLDELGSPKGAMARVFGVFDLQQARHLAAKIINPRLLDEEHDLRRRFLAQFYKEARIMEELEHPGIVRLYDYNIDGELPFLVMDHIQGESLDDRLRREGRLTLVEAVAILEPVVEAVAYAHTKGVVHRDIKPSNILIDWDGRSYLTDFGIARAAQESGLSTFTARTLGSFQLGTPMYMAPEQALRLRESIGPHTDQYSLAVVVWRMLAGRYYLARAERRENEDYISMVVGSPPLPLSRYVPNIPPRAEQAIARALSKSPYDRFDSVREFMDELGRALVNPEWNMSENALKGWQEPYWLNAAPDQAAPAARPEHAAQRSDNLEQPDLEVPRARKGTQPLNLTLPDWLENGEGRIAEAEATNNEQAHLPEPEPIAILTDDDLDALFPAKDRFSPSELPALTGLVPREEDFREGLDHSFGEAALSPQDQPEPVSAPGTASPSVATTVAGDFWKVQPLPYPGSSATSGLYRLNWNTAYRNEKWAFQAVRHCLRGRFPFVGLGLVVALSLITMWIVSSLVGLDFMALSLAAILASATTLLLAWWNRGNSLRGAQPVVITGWLTGVSGPYLETAKGHLILREGSAADGQPDPCSLVLAPSLAQANSPEALLNYYFWDKDRLELAPDLMNQRLALVVVQHKGSSLFSFAGLKVLPDLRLD